MKILLLSSIILCSLPSFAQGFLSSNQFTIGTGVLSYNAFKTTTTNNAKSSTLGTNYLLPIQGQMNLTAFSYNISPRVLFTPVPVESTDKGIKTSVLLFSIPIKKQFSESFTGSLGLGYMIRTLKGAGGTTVLNNGLSTDTFLLPANTVTNKNFLLESSISYDFTQYRLDLEGLLSSPLSSERTISFLLTLNYKL